MRTGQHPPFTSSFTNVIKASERSTDVMDEHARGEKVELELDSFVAKRDAQRRRAEGERPSEAPWRQSERRYDARRRSENRWEWVRFFDRMAASHASLAKDYERRAEELCSEAKEGAA